MSETALRRHASLHKLGVRHLRKIEIGKRLVFSDLDYDIAAQPIKHKGAAAEELKKFKVAELRRLAKDYGIPAWAATRDVLVSRILQHEEWLDRQDGTGVVLRPRSLAAQRAAPKVHRTYNGPGDDGKSTSECQLTSQLSGSGRDGSWNTTRRC